MYHLTTILALSACIVQGTWATTPTLLTTLDYGTFQGTYNSKYNISSWRKIPFAAPPIGENRFRAPQPPLPLNSTYDTDSSFPRCPQLALNGSEDCLYLGVYSRPWSQGQPLRPVFVQFSSGGFVQGAASTNAPGPAYATLNVSDFNDWVAVGPNYRTNAFGFLPGSAVFDDPMSDLNPGLLDQQEALKWVNKYIQNFGGDPNNVTIWGQSAGGGSVLAHTIANDGKTNPPLFSKAIASSPYWPKTYAYNDTESELIYERFTNLTNCTGPGSLQCLKRADLDVLRTAAYTIRLSDKYGKSSFTWAPVIDGRFLTSKLSEATINRRMNGDYFFGSYNTYEGEYFIPSALQNTTTRNGYNSSQASFEKYLNGFLPGFTRAELATVMKLYPSIGSSEVIPVYNTTYLRAQLIYRDLVLACPAYWTARAMKTGYIAEYSIGAANHGDEKKWWSAINSVQTSNPVVYQGFAGALASFLNTGNPNAKKLTNSSQPAVPEINKTGNEWVIEERGFRNVKVGQLEARCAFWRGVVVDLY